MSKITKNAKIGILIKVVTQNILRIINCRMTDDDVKRVKNQLCAEVDYQSGQINHGEFMTLLEKNAIL